ncbi:reverse transcriptase domain-containing protein [Tanacetum coccineum]|uniref:Reverse transcriptase domain-containing protein n=1 Tax=Tanacetum coccineum TaxID=301880 RepID=A0ABQ4ZXN0_9ASTR
MAEGDEDKTSFFAGEGVFCYRKMPFGLKNAGATYQRLVDKVFHDQIGRNLEKLNPKKCSFAIEEGPFIGHLITKQGTRANPSKVKSITDLEQPKMLKDVQSLNGKIAALIRFLSKGVERSLPFFKGAELNYPGMEKLILELAHAARRLRRGDKTPKDFLIEVPLKDNEKKAEEYADTKSMKTELSCEWKLFTNGAASSDGSGNENYKPGNLRRLTVAGKLNKSAGRSPMKWSIEEKEILQVETKEGKSWMTPIYEYLVSGLLPEDPKESRKIRVKEPQHKLIRGNLYKRTFYSTWLHCIASLQTDDIVKEVHEGSYGFNIEPRSMVVRITKQGYYWPLMHRDAAKVLQDCEKCKEQSAIRKVAESDAITARSGWPFSHWGVNILGPLPTAPRGFKFLAIAIEHSTKWVEAKPLTVINRMNVERFVWEYVVCRFGVPRTINSKDEKHFREGIFADLCKGLKVTQSFFPIMEHMEIINHIKK